MNALEFLAEAADNIGVLRGPDASLFSVEQVCYFTYLYYFRQIY